MDEQVVAYPYNGILLSNGKGLTTDVYNHIDMIRIIINERSQAPNCIFHVYDSIYFSKGQNFRNRHLISVARKWRWWVTYKGAESNL